MFCDATLAQRLEYAEASTTQHYVAARAWLRPEAGCSSASIGDGVACFAGAGSPLNRVVALGMTQRVDRAVIEACTAFFADRNETPRLDLCPLAHSSLLTALEQSGYAVAQFKQVYVRRLADWPDRPPPSTPIETAPITRRDADHWAQVVAGAFHGAAPGALDLEIALPNPHKPDTTCFLACIAGEPAGGGAIAIHDGVAICYSTSVRPEVRRLGVQSALLYARLTYAKAHGCDLVMVQTTPGSASQRNVARFGFQLAYTKPTLARPLSG